MKATSSTRKPRIAVVTGANKGIGHEICKHLAAHGATVVLTARHEQRGHDALQELSGFDFLGNLVFHQLDVVDPSSIASTAEFVRNRFGKLDILVNNAGISGVIIDVDALKASGYGSQGPDGSHIDWNGILTETYELAVECLETNYYGAKRMIEAFLPLLNLSDAPRIVNVSSSMGNLKYIQNQWAKGVLSDFINLTEENVEVVLNEFLKDFQNCLLEANQWPPFMSAYAVSKAAVNAYTRIIAKKHPTFLINCVCPGFVKTDLNCNTGNLTAEEAAKSPARLALLPDDGPSGLFFIGDEVSSFD